MKKILLFTAVISLLISCENKEKSNDADTVKEVAEVVEMSDESGVESDEIQQTQEEQMIAQEETEDDGLYQPPFKVTIKSDYRDGGWKYDQEYTFSILKNGRLTGTYESKRRDAYDRGDWEEYSPKEEFSGKWSTSSISMGDGRLKVYAIDRNDRESTIYLPATCDYIWMCNYAWLECENWNTQVAMKVTSVEKL